MSAVEDETPGMGDIVEHKMNTSVFGIVIGFMGSLVAVRASPSLSVLWFHEWELRQVEDDEYHPTEDEMQPEISNVIDFTKARELRAATKTKGAVA